MRFELRSLCPTFLISSLMVFALTACDKIQILDSSHGAVSACEEKLKETLVSPSSYDRQSAEYYVQDFSFDNYYESEGGDNCKPFTSSDCDELKKIYRANGVKTWLLASADLKADRNVAEIQNRIEKQQLPNVSDKVKWQADHDYLYFIYQRKYGPGKTNKLPAALVGIEYDAANAFNASIRSKYVCQFPPTNRDHYSNYDIY